MDIRVRNIDENSFLMDKSFNLVNLVKDSIYLYNEEDNNYFIPQNIIDWFNEWDFKNYNPNIYSHGFHQYPAKFTPQLVRKLLRVFTDDKSIVLDIFSGSGTTLVESLLLNRKQSIGIELNPFACFIAKVKTTPIEPSLLENEFSVIKDKFFKINKVNLHNFKNIDYWFKEKQIEDLSKLRHIIIELKHNDIRDFFFICLSNVVRKVSLTHHHGFKLHRDKSKLKESFNPDVFELFQNNFYKNLSLMADFYNISKESKTEVKIIEGDSRVKQDIPENSIDFILTSPPYGDSKTTVAYGQFSRLSWQWIKNDENINKIDRQLLGGSSVSNISSVLNILELSHTLKEQFSLLNQINQKRAKEVLLFYKDLFESIKNAYFYLKKGKYFVLVTGNRTVSNIVLRTDLIISEMANNLGFKTELILNRNIINKRMPSLNSPTNKRGEVSATMLKENIIFLKKN